MWRDGIDICDAALGEDLILMFSRDDADFFVIGRFYKIRGKTVFATDERVRERMFLLGFNPFAPDFFTNAPKRKI